MPRAAIISWDHKSGRIALLSTLAVDSYGAQPEELEIERIASLSTGAAHVFIDPTEAGMAKLARFLQRIAPIMPDGSYREATGLPFIEPSDEDWKRAQRFSSPRAARGVKAPKRKMSFEEVMSLLDNLPEPQDE